MPAIEDFLRAAFSLATTNIPRAPRSPLAPLVRTGLYLLSTPARFRTDNNEDTKILDVHFLESGVERQQQIMRNIHYPRFAY